MLRPALEVSRRDSEGLNFMFAWLVPQNSAHAPFHAFVPPESGENHR